MVATATLEFPNRGASPWPVGADYYRRPAAVHHRDPAFLRPDLGRVLSARGGGPHGRLSRRLLMILPAGTSLSSRLITVAGWGNHDMANELGPHHGPDSDWRLEPRDRFQALSLRGGMAFFQSGRVRIGMDELAPQAFPTSPTSVRLMAPCRILQQSILSRFSRSSLLR